MRPQRLMAQLLALALLGVTVSALPAANSGTNSSRKLLYILLDGFRYDYVDDLPASELPGFTEFISGGVKARWVNPLRPTLSYPTWTTLVTGLYAESHNLVGNYFYDAKDKDVFSLFDNESTGKPKWWTAEPLWTTATKAGLRVALHLWARCDVPIDDILPESCERFSVITGPEIFRTNIDKALKNFEEGFNLVQVYTEHLDNIGHTIGPETEERKKATREIDETLVYLQTRLREMGMEDEVNIVIVSDHGMTNTAPGTITRLELDDYIPEDAPVENIADKGPYINIKVNSPDRVDEVYESVSSMPGVTAYKHDDVPDSFHLAGSPYMHDILLIADIGTFMMASNRSWQLPALNDFVFYGAHGYSPDEQQMKAIFYAKGPAFKTNTVIEPIDIVDIYQVLTTVLDIHPQPNNGTLAHVKGAFAAAPLPPTAGGVLLLSLMATMASLKGVLGGC